MLTPIPVTDAADPRLADFARLRDPSYRERVEAANGFFVAESPLVIRRVVASGRRLRAALVTEPQLDALATDLAAAGAPVYVAPVDVLRSIVGFDLHRGAVASVQRWPRPAVSDVLRGASRVAVCERLNDHENLGVLFRSAAALGIDAVLLDAESADPLYRRCVRVSIGGSGRAPARSGRPRPVAGLDRCGRRPRPHSHARRRRLAECRDGGRDRVLRVGSGQRLIAFDSAVDDLDGARKDDGRKQRPVVGHEQDGAFVVRER